MGSESTTTTDHTARRFSRLGAVTLVILALPGCDGGAGGDAAAFCDQVGDDIEVFRDANGQVSPPIVGTLRDLADVAPDELVDDFEAVTEGSEGVELDRALANIEDFLVEECGLEIRS